MSGRPAVLSMKNRKGTQTVVNVTYVAQNSVDQSYAICIAGTDFDSWYDWLVEDEKVQSLVPCDGLLGAGQTLQAWLTSLTGPLTLNVTGHSLGGGALSVVVALAAKHAERKPHEGDARAV